MSRRREIIFNMTHGRCIYCGCELDIDSFHIDHMIPKSKGGKDAGNVFPTCQDCNLAKGNLSVEEFRDKIKLMCVGTHTGRMMIKYCDAKEKPEVRFFFEKMHLDEEHDYGDIQKHIYNILDR